MYVQHPQRIFPNQVGHHMDRQEMLQMQMQQWAQQQQMANAGNQNSVLGQQIGELLLEAEDPNKEPEDDDTNQPAVRRPLAPRNYYRGFESQKQGPPTGHSGFHPRPQKHHNSEFDKTVGHHSGGLKLSNQNGIPSHRNNFNYFCCLVLFSLNSFEIISQCYLTHLSTCAYNTNKYISMLLQSVNL